MNQMIKVWSVLLLLPLIPVILLYVFFADRNYFELKDTARGIVAMGPIAAYVGIILIGWTIYRKMVPPPDPSLEDLVGDWSFESRSGSGSFGKGTCYIRNDKGELTISGDFARTDGKEAGNWHCEMVKVKNNRLLMAYSLTTVREMGNDTLDGITILSLGNPPVAKMTGIWVVAGREKMSGNVIYSRINAKSSRMAG